MAMPAVGARKSNWMRWLPVGIPYLWSFLFFLLPFVIVLRIAFSNSELAMPPFSPVFDIGGEGKGVGDAAVDDVGAFVELLRDQIADIVHHISIVACTADQGIDTRSTIKRVVAGAAAQCVVTTVSDHAIVEHIA